MDEPKNDTCAVLDADKQRIARGRLMLEADRQEITFTPASNVTLEEMQRVAFLWPDGEDMVAVTNVRARPANLPGFLMDAAR